jgi:hypothetical protein
VVAVRLVDGTRGPDDIGYMRGKYISYSDEVAARVLALLAEGASLAAVGRMEEMPSFTTLIRWRQERPDFQAAYLAACAARPPGRRPRGPYGTRAEIAARRAARPAKRPAGRPGRYSLKLAEEVCARVAAGESMLDLGQDPSLPSTQSLYNWLEEHEKFRLKYAVACEMRADLLAEEALAIADDASGDFIQGPDGLEPNMQAIRRARMMIDLRKWRAGKLCPRRYGLRPVVDEPRRDGEKTHEDWLLELE